MRRSLALRGWSGKRVPLDFPEEARRSPSKKDTKRWCRGKAGTEHQTEWIRDRRYEYGSLATRPDCEAWFTKSCSVCGRHLAFCTWSTSPCVCGNHAVGLVAGPDRRERAAEPSESVNGQGSRQLAIVRLVRA